MGSHTPPTRLAILETDTPLPNTKEQYNGYSGVFTSLLLRAAESQDVPLSSLLTVTAHHVVPDSDIVPVSYPSPDDIDAILITGSKHNAFDDEPWISDLVNYTRSCIQGGRIRVIGVCFGHQIVGRTLGVPVQRSDKGWEVAVVEVDLTETGKSLFGLKKLRIHQMHRDVVTANPPDSLPLAHTELCPVQGFYSPRRYITVQGHPEFTGAIVTEIVRTRNRQGIFTDDFSGEALSRANLDHDGVAVARGFLRFLRE
ncbi:glutamine amidotransferase class-I [Sodiomyces alkalinus F11]|uniref:Glutamine amidotransferase class-I n=1 Tax=Sodiomyces alkalinus (strain CBS 110278 / VKM F-3762 / F11) TaxID=1314773 RepID=A0A3N2Q619_SODAK|nr:glutamine amidotransferase class-I [Sodiomyces alkalinus F11]ROT42233.1 glutamine amidotransferase class-I [Sodiomyces alkalinus F11]